MPKYILFLKLSESVEKNRKTHLTAIARQFGCKVLKERSTMVIVEAESERIEKLKTEHPEVGVTLEKQYHTTT